MKHVESSTLQEPGMAIAPSRGERMNAGFEELALPFLDSAYNLARWLTQNDHEAEDLVQETFLKALRGFHSFQAGTNFRAWMFQILRNTFLSSRTCAASILTTSLESEDDRIELAVECGTPETILMSQFASGLLYRAIDNLPIHYRETFLLCEMEEMSYREIAEILSIPVGTVMSRLARARRFIRELLQVTLASRSHSHTDGSQVLKAAWPITPAEVASEK